MNPVEISRSESFKNLSTYLLKGKSRLPSPEKTLGDISQQHSVFTRQDIARHLNKAIDEATSMGYAIDRVLASDDIVVMRSNDEADENLYYSTWEMVSIERNMMETTQRMEASKTHSVNPQYVETAIERANAVLVEQAGAELSQEQSEAIQHITGAEKLSVVSGLAGAGKSTMLAAACEAWEAQGYNVYGAALSGLAAEGLQNSSKIQSRTLASYELGWMNGYRELSNNDVFVIDEAGMVGSRQLARFVEVAEKAGAKLVLVGDGEQLQAIGAGAPFRQSVEEFDAAKLENVIRQREAWQQQATKDFSNNRTFEALQAYQEKGCIEFCKDTDETVEALAVDYLNDLEQHPDQSRIALTHRRIDVKEINQVIRNKRLEAGQIGEGVDFKTDDGQRVFAIGDRLICLENDRDLCVKNGMLGTVVDVRDGVLFTQLDGGDKRVVEISEANYTAINYGYASTIHKSQGVSVDRSFVMASYTMDRHLSYVAMSRHRDSTQLYASREQFNSMGALASRLGREGLKRSTLDYNIDMTKSLKKTIQTAHEDDKVGWTQTYNLGKTSDLKAWEMMTATAESAGEIKKAVAEANGVKYKASKKCTKPVYHFTITWPEEDAPSEKLQRLAVDEAIAALDLGMHEALAVQHLDRKPHVHVMLNLVDPDTGMSASTSLKIGEGQKKASKLSNSHRKFRQWANGFEKRHSLKITEGSALNEKRRQAGEKVDARRKSRAVYEQKHEEKHSVDLSHYVFKQAAPGTSGKQYTASKIGVIGNRLKAKHDLQYETLNVKFKAKMLQLHTEKKKTIAEHERKFARVYKQRKTDLYLAQQKRKKAFILAEARSPSLDMMFNSVSALFTVMGERENILKALSSATSVTGRRQVLERWDKAERDALYKLENSERAAYVDRKVVQVFDKKIDEAQKGYLREDSTLRHSHAEQRQVLQQRWRDYSAGRSAKAQQSVHQSVEPSLEQAVRQESGHSQSLHLSLD